MEGYEEEEARNRLEECVLQRLGAGSLASLEAVAQESA